MKDADEVGVVLVPRVRVEPLGLARARDWSKGNLGAEELRRLVKYDPETGVFVHAAGKCIGQIAGTTNGNGYRLLKLKGRIYRAHRLAWLHVYGCWPAGEVDHLNGIRDDNRLANLRDVPNLVNQQNRRQPLKRGKSGRLGVTLTRGRYVAQIHFCGTDIRLGSFDNPDHAHDLYVRAKRILHPGGTL